MRLPALLSVIGLAAWAQPMSVESATPAKPGRFELTVVPVAVQVNGKYTQHAGTFGSATWYLRERLGLQLLGGANWLNAESNFNSELVEKFRVEAQWASSLLWTWGAFGGVEVEPFVGELTVFQGAKIRLGLVLSLGAGAGGTRHQLKPQTSTPPTFADTGVRFMGTFSAGARLQLGERITLRLAIRDVLYSAQVTSVNGCTEVRTSVVLGQSYPCTAFRAEDLGLARRLLVSSSSEVVNNLALSLGLGVLF